MNNFKFAAGLCILMASTASLASQSFNFDANAPFYVAADLGIFQASFNSSYIDTTDLIPQNFTDAFQQHGYTEGLAIGYSAVIRQQYILGAEISGNYDSHSANFQAGAASAAFSDVVNVNNHFDFSFLPGLKLSHSVSAFLKLGYTRASVQDTLISPVGFTPTSTRFRTNTNANGFIAGVKLEKMLPQHISVFVEGDYRDYGTVSFSGFQNFTASYNNSSHIYTYDALLGAAYHF